MIRFAVTLPSDRWNAVMGGVRLLNWGADPYLQHYGLQINSIAAKVKARILPSPTVHFGAGSKEPTIKPVDMIQGRWRLDGRKFAMCNQARPLKAWGMCISKFYRNLKATRNIPANLLVQYRVVAQFRPRQQKLSLASLFKSTRAMAGSL